MKDNYGNEHSEKDGRFTSKSSTEAEQKRADELTSNVDEFFDNSKEITLEVEKVLGQEYTGLKGQEAISKLLKERQGHIKDAFKRSDIGAITLMWGDDGSGLQHIVKQRESKNIEINEFMEDLTDVIENGKLVRINEKGRYEIMKDRKMAIISPKLRDGKITYLFTAYKTRKK